MNPKLIFGNPIKYSFLPENISIYPELRDSFLKRHSYQDIILRKKCNCITSSSNILFKGVVPQHKFYLNKYSGKHTSLITYIKTVLIFLKNPKKKLNATYIWICTSSTPNYYHWIIDVLIKIIGLKKYYTDLPPLLISEEALSVQFIQQILEFHSIDYFILRNNITYQVNQIITPITVKNDRHFSIENLLFFRKDLLSKQNNLKRRVFISRKNAPIRRIINETEIYEILSQYQFEIIEAENLSYKAASKIIFSFSN